MNLTKMILEVLSEKKSPKKRIKKKRSKPFKSPVLWGPWGYWGGGYYSYPDGGSEGFGGDSGGGGES